MVGGSDHDILVVGAGFAGAVLAERLATECNLRVLVVDRRSTLGGNAHDSTDAAGVLLHRHGPHYFRTNSERILSYLSRFTEWRRVEFRFLSRAGGRDWSFPLNLRTFEQYLGRDSSPEEMEEYLRRWKRKDPPRNFEEEMIARVGETFYAMFFRDYTRKQWGRDPAELDAALARRVTVRTDRDDRGFTDGFQGLPSEGYTRMFERMLSDPRITLRLGCGHRDAGAVGEFLHTVFTGAVDEYFDNCFGSLSYRSLRFEEETLQTEFFQPVVQVNYPGEEPFTRIVEMKHATGQSLPVTTIVREYPQAHVSGREAYYPVPTEAARRQYRLYEELAMAEKRVSFVGRLATYRYYDMDQVVGMALSEFENLRMKVGTRP
jgi:UDP-galactopyranose mutase